MKKAIVMVFLFCHTGAFAAIPWYYDGDERVYCEWTTNLYDDTDGYCIQERDDVCFNFAAGAAETERAVLYSFLSSDGGISCPYYKIHAIITYAVKCQPGYTYVKHSITDLGIPMGCATDNFNASHWDPCAHMSGGAVVSSYGECVKECTQDASSCKTSTDFVDFGTGCQRKIVTATWDAKNCQCNYTYNARCKAGYYGTPIAISCMGCQKCPFYIDANGTTWPATSPVGATSKEQCSVAGFSNGFGSGHFEPACNWKN